ncbi:MAG: hypothetical protein ABSD59_12045 [Terracidiphilus sp.]|jgi:hypothetical protein
MDLYSHWNRSIPGVLAGAGLWALLNYLSVSPLSPWRFLLVSVLIVYLLGRILVWLRLWGAYVERRLEDVEARIQGDDPIYYCDDSTSRLLRNGLHERLERIEEKIDAGNRKPTEGPGT